MPAFCTVPVPLREFPIYMLPLANVCKVTLMPVIALKKLKPPSTAIYYVKLVNVAGTANVVFKCDTEPTFNV